MATTVELKDKQAQENKISICDMMKKNTSKIIRKAEGQIPSYAQIYSDYYKEYLHTVDDVFGTCYIAEKEFFDKMGFDQNMINVIDANWDSFTKGYENQLDLANNFLRTFVKTRIMTMKSFDNYIHLVMDSYAKSLSVFNSTIK